MSNPAVPLGSLQIGKRFTFQGAPGVLTGRAKDDGYIVMLREQHRTTAGSYRFVEHIWSGAMLVTPDMRPKRGAALTVGKKAPAF